MFRDMPKPDEITDYAPYLDLICKHVDNVIEGDKEKKNEYVFTL